jgi:predicted metal-dependent HD superfamily phosphohydrolase
MTTPSYDECLVDAELRARAAYAEPGRHYHDEQHLDDCLQQLDQIPGLGERELRLIRWAILWHDAIYDEERSAELARRELLACGVDESDADEVARLIRLTFGHRVEASDRLGALLVSIDLSILGADPDRYRAYVQGVRREYAHVPDAMWQAGRSELLKRFLAADPLYPDPGYRERLEAQARGNMQEELSSLGEG